MHAVDLLTLCCALSATPRAQQPTTTAPAQTLVRAAADLRRVAAVAAAQDHTFAGSCAFPTLDPSEPAVPFTIARSAELDWLRLGNHVVVRRGAAQLVQHSAPTWQLPQGNAPEPPLVPLELLQQSATAVVLRSEPCSHADRPAQRAVLQWRGNAARRLLDQLTVPCTRSQQLLEQFAVVASKEEQGKNFVIDGTVTYDPANHAWFGCSLRIAMIDREREPSSEPPLPPAGLQPLPHRIDYQFAFELTRIDAPPVAWPELSADDRGRLVAATKR
ncbi:MAG: hypothetical protein MUC36_05985 [Planctomycetes bacterium]|jgi:hypothetical protein|nr:hypothetical protein [Planctomycetota bacterium]